jgi:hypothetical protein
MVEVVVERLREVVVVKVVEVVGVVEVHQWLGTFHNHSSPYNRSSYGY